MDDNRSCQVKRYDCFDDIERKLRNALINLCLKTWNDEIFDHGFTAKSLVTELRIKQKHYFYLAPDDQGDIAGYSVIIPSAREIEENRYGIIPLPLPDGVSAREIAYLAAIAVWPKCKGKKYGYAICEKIFQDCRAEGFKKVTLYTFGNNYHGLKFFEKIGFKEFFRTKRNIAGSEKELVYFYYDL